MKITIASLETRHFTFEGYGESEKQAKAALRRGVEKHCVDYAVPHSAFFEEYGANIQVRTVEIGSAWRDCEMIVGPE